MRKPLRRTAALLVCLVLSAGAASCNKALMKENQRLKQEVADYLADRARLQVLVDELEAKNNVLASENESLRLRVTLLAENLSRCEAATKP